jgi:hypothetical protein
MKNMKIKASQLPVIKFTAGVLTLGASLMLCTSMHAALTEIVPFTGSTGEDWETFGGGTILASPAEIMGSGSGVTIASANMYIYEPGSHSFDLGGTTATVADGTKGMALDGEAQTATITFQNPVYQFGAYWGVRRFVENFGPGEPPNVLLNFSDGSSYTFTYGSFDGALEWHGWSSTVGLTSIKFTGDYVVIDGLQADIAPVPEPTTFIAGALLALPFALQSLRYLRNRKRAV